MKTLVVTLTLVACVAQVLNSMPDTATVVNILGEMGKDTGKHVQRITRRSPDAIRDVLASWSAAAEAFLKGSLNKRNYTAEELKNFEVCGSHVCVEIKSNISQLFAQANNTTKMSSGAR